MAGAMLPMLLAMAPQLLEGVDRIVNSRKGGGLKQALANAGTRNKGKKQKPKAKPKGKNKKPRKKQAKKSGGNPAKSQTGVGTIQQGGSLAVHKPIPSNYASEAVTMGKTVIGRTPGGGEIVRYVDTLGYVDNTNGIASFGDAINQTGVLGSGILAASQFGLNPESGRILPTYFLDAETWQKWRPLGVALHYRQACSSTQTGQVHLGFVDTPNATEAAALLETTAAKFDATEHTVVGALNQDLSAHFTPESWNPKEGGASWYELGGSSALNADFYAGFVNVATDMSSGSAALTGRLYIEFLVEFAAARAPYTGAAGLPSLARRAKLAHKLSEEERQVIRAKFVDIVKKLYTDIIEEMDRPPAPRELVPQMTKSQVVSAMVDLAGRSTSVTRRQ